MTPGFDLAEAHIGRFRIVSYPELRAKATVLAGQILRDHKNTPGGVIIAPILMGGGLPARLVIDALLPFGIVGGVAPCRIRRYVGIGSSVAAQIDIKLSKIRVKNRVVLGVDDLVDGGETMASFLMHAMDQGAAHVDGAVIFSKSQSSVEPKYIAEAGVKEWLVLPGEEHDFMHEVSQNEPEVRSLKTSELATYFTRLGIPGPTVAAWQGLARSDTMNTTDYAQTQ